MKLSVITINYNNASGLERTIEGVISQDFNDFEYIIIDGGSTDGSVDIIKKYADKVSYWVSEADKGIFNAMNKGIKQAKGEYILFTNSGDKLYDNKVISEVFAKSTDKDFIYGNMHRQFPDGHTDVLTMPENLNIYFMFSCSVHHPSSFTKRELFLKYGFFREDLKIVADWAFFLNLVAFTNATRQYIPIIISSFSMDGVSSDDELREAEREKVLDETFSSELSETVKFRYTFYSYEKFYNKKVFKLIRKIKLFFKQ